MLNSMLSIFSGIFGSQSPFSAYNFREEPKTLENTDFFGSPECRKIINSSV